MNWSKIFRNIFSNWASYVVTAVIGFVLAPIIVNSLGAAGYGLWTLVLSLTGYFGLLDLGIRSSVGRFVAHHMALSEEENVNRTVNTAFVMLSIAGLLALVTTAVFVTFFFSSFKIDPQQAASGRTALLITGFNISCILPLGVFSAVLIGLERFDILSGVTIIAEIARALLVISSLKLGYGLVGLALVALLITVAQYTALTIFVRFHYHPLKLGPRYADRETARKLWSFGIYRFVWIVANQLIYYSSSVVIGVFLGARSIAFYAIAASLISYARNVVSLVTDPFAPAATRMNAQDNLEGLRRVMLFATTMALLITLPLCIGLIAFGEAFIVLWMGAEYAVSSQILTILVISQFLSMPQYVSALVLAGMARHRMLAYLALFEGLANVLFSFFLITRLDLAGVAWASVIPNAICAGLIVPLYTLKQLRMPVRTYIAMAWLRPLACAIPIALLAALIAPRGHSLSWLGLAAKACAVGGVFAATSLFVCFTPEQRAAAFAKAANLLSREPAPNEV